MQNFVLKKLLFSIALIFGSSSSNADALIVIVNQGNPVASLSDAEVKRIFLGKMKRFPSGAKVKPTDYKKGKSLRSTFYQKVAKKSVKDVENYWYRLVFTGKGVPPKPMSSAKDVINYVSENENAIGYIKESQLTSAVKKVLKIK